MILETLAILIAEQVVVEFSLPGHMNVGEIKALMKEAALCSPYVYRKKPVNVLTDKRRNRFA